MKTEPFAGDDLSFDDFLGGRIRIAQPRTGYRAGIDPILLAALVPARPGDSVLELGCGAGVALAALGARVADLALAGLELQPAYADLARYNLKENDLTGLIYDGSVDAPPADLRQHRFNHVLANPPFFDPACGGRARDAGRALGRAGALPLRDWLACAARRTRPGGTVTCLQRIERLPDVLSAMPVQLGSVRVLPLFSRPGRAPRRFVLSALAGGKAAFRLDAGLVLHDGATHRDGTDGYTARIRAVLRDAAGLDWPCT